MATWVVNYDDMAVELSAVGDGAVDGAVDGAFDYLWFGQRNSFINRFDAC